MMKKLILVLIPVFLLSFSLVSAATMECFDDGSIKIKGMSKKRLIYATEKGSKEGYFEVPGKYSEIKLEKKTEYNFYSDEAIFVNQEATKYQIEYGSSKATITCPAFKFSCRIFNISVEYCYNRDGLFTSKFMVYNFHFDETNVLRFTHPFMLKYEAVTKGKERVIHGPDRFTPGYKDLNITMRKLNAGSKFILKWPMDKKIDKFYIRYDDCRQKRYNFYESAECTEATACTIDKDCFEDENCTGNLCEKLDCGECQYVGNHTCLDYSCCLDEDCLAKERCEDHVCVKFECAEEEVVANHTCAVLECAEDEYVAEHACVKLNCADDEEAVEHQCFKLECGGFSKAVKHECIGLFKYWWGKIFGGSEGE